MRIEWTPEFEKWFRKLKDQQAKKKIMARLIRLEYSENWGDFKVLSSDIRELRVDHGPGYRVYLSKEMVDGEEKWVLVLNAGTKSGQQRDIQKAQDLFTDHIENKKGE
ncbi:type II toxin-antitoxin system RelE/ParE family toxin [Persicobacter diffluens]|uniref:Type II toxin-antitoxin system RelE/ParE family toxin n=1 Tax=Persicobacter diffluens TaxID=981 RepID=A0AAN5AQJ0_9BACT|nr:hypothetical protein PEDI_54400 [Persicobacter diffluens]